MRLDAIAKVIRSKNAGPSLLTLDVMLPDKAAFTYVAERIASLRQQVARRYGRSENGVAVLPFEPVARGQDHAAARHCLWRCRRS